jgi:hypothetical protein
MIKRISLILFSVIFCVFILCSCGETDEEGHILQSFADLYGRAKILNEAVYGKGFPYEGEDDPADYTVAHYCVVKEDCPYANTEEMKTAIKETYSANYAASIIGIMFEGMSYDSEQITGFQPRYKDIEGKLAVDISYGGFDISTELLTDTARIKENKPKKCTVEVDYTAESGNGTLSVKLVKENGKWLLDSATY